MSTAQKLVASFIEFLDDQVASGVIIDTSAESLEVAKQCLESAFEVDLNDPAYKSSEKLIEIFASQTDKKGIPSREASPEDKELAEKLKNQGNDLMRDEKYDDAIASYGQAISLNGKHAVYYCNRAAAYLKLDQAQNALNDCQKALEIDPKYGKAYGRLGLAYTSLGKHVDAKECYKKALELDPSNQGYQTNLDNAEQQLKDTRIGGGGGAGGLGNMLGGMDLSSILNNPAMMNMAANMMSNPQMQQMMTSMMSGAAAGDPNSQPGGQEGISSLLNAGQTLAQQMQQSNPELVEQLRQQMPPPDGAQRPPDQQQ